MDHNETEKLTEDTSQLIRAYGLLIIGFPLSFVPAGIISGLGWLLLLIGIIYAYRLKKRLADTVVGSNHVRWIIRTFWISSLYLSIAMTLQMLAVTMFADTSAIESLQQTLQSGNPSPDQVTLMLAEFQKTNSSLIIGSKVLTYGPCLLFFALRFIKGYRLAEAYKPVENVKTWWL